MRTKINNWFNPTTGEILYGIDVLHERLWCHAMENGKPLMFKTKAERDAKRAEVRRWKKGLLILG